MMNYSYWERETYFKNLDLVIAGGGFTGYSAAIQFLKSRPGSKILILEPDPFGALASSKNAGFICFGSSAELVHYKQEFGEDQLKSLLLKGKLGSERMLKWLGARNLEYKSTGASELFLKQDAETYKTSLNELSLLNIMFKEAGISELQFAEGRKSNHSFSTDHFLGEILINSEAQIDSSKALLSYRKYASNLGNVKLLPFFLDEYKQLKNSVSLKLTNGIEFKTKKLLVAVNALAAHFTKEKSIETARGMVLVTKPIDGLKMNRNYHQNSGYIYFRNHGSRIVIGGARDIDSQAEATSETGYNAQIEEHLLRMLNDVILPGRKVEIEHKWNGFMGFTETGQPLDSQLDDTVYFAAGFNGMGVAISNQLGYEVANKIANDW